MFAITCLQDGIKAGGQGQRLTMVVIVHPSYPKIILRIGETLESEIY